MALSPGKKRPARVFLVTLLLILLYFILFPYPLGKEMIAPAWATAADQARAATVGSPLADKGAAPFHLGPGFGYVRADGRILHAEKTLFGVALSAAGYVNYTRLGTDWIMYDPRGVRLFSFSGRGYPLFSPDGRRTFNIKSDLTGIVELSGTGEALWDRDFPSLMTSISIQGEALLVGLLNGTVLLLNTQGSPVFELSPEGSRFPVILGCALSPDAQLIAFVSGIDPQFLTVMQRKGSTFAELGKIRLSSAFRKEVRMTFSPGSRFLAFQGEGSMGIFDPESAQVSWIGVRGDVAGIASAGAGRFAAVLSRDGSLAELRIVEPFSAPVARESFPARDLFLGSLDGQLLLGVDDTLLRIDVEAM